MKNINLFKSKPFYAIFQDLQNTLDFQIFLKVKNIPLISFQHGVTREISKVSDYYSILDECNVADIVFSYNESYKNITTSTPYYNQLISIGSIYHKNRFKLKKIIPFYLFQKNQLFAR